MADRRVAVIIPAFRAQQLIGQAVGSVLAQTYQDWEIWVIADDGEDYERVLAGQGWRDNRLHFLSSGEVGTGASRARNLALERIDTAYAAILDADDRMKPEKLARAVQVLGDHPIVSVALEVLDDSYRRLRLVGVGADRVLTPGAYKFTSLSMDSMIVWDRRRTDARYDPTLSNMTDLELLLQLWQQAPGTFHIGTPLHDYVKLSKSMSNGPNVTEGMIRSKQALLARLEGGYYRLDGAAVAGLAAFLRLSLAAEAAYPAALQQRPGLLFEDHLEPMLRAYEAETARAV
ncbi:MAG: glycosyltransferase family 2 protein [Devosia sp.]